MAITVSLPEQGPPGNLRTLPLAARRRQCRSGNGSQLVYKHAISTIAPTQATRMEAYDQASRRSPFLLRKIRSAPVLRASRQRWPALAWMRFPDGRCRHPKPPPLLWYAHGAPPGHTRDA
ncbi:hypothetical protein D3878_02550 [Noviherbaspirillum sedimenti]|uniref:Uncharacterized protein n=1 Tax=Noviherbaspirillum sedimenti TaxID=2320865 RepID=A0A3A3FWJ8_9BURK|nr:hypothetical protein D3878_02550 [Noviherbaspirillum sedimenti]